MVDGDVHVAAHLARELRHDCGPEPVEVQVPLQQVIEAQREHLTDVASHGRHDHRTQCRQPRVDPCSDPNTIWNPSYETCVSRFGCVGTCVTRGCVGLWNMPVFNPIMFAIAWQRTAESSPQRTRLDP
jgi:hypothetical protein